MPIDKQRVYRGIIHMTESHIAQARIKIVATVHVIDVSLPVTQAIVPAPNGPCHPEIPTPGVWWLG